ncbi:MAG: hypothetical protein M3138_06300, partial [Actinomycetota bacterium]|nr:hypothetical protein [Actinomycetota bacterium]
SRRGTKAEARSPFGNRASRRSEPTSLEVDRADDLLDLLFEGRARVRVRLGFDHEDGPLDFDDPHPDRVADPRVSDQKQTEARSGNRITSPSACIAFLDAARRRNA